MTRDEVGEFLRALGAKVSSGVSSKTDYLIVGDKPSKSKIEKAKKLGVKIITEDEFLEMLGYAEETKESKTSS